jgi:hypothetical protein
MKSDNTLNIKVVSTDGNEVFFKIKRTTKLNKLKVCEPYKDLGRSCIRPLMLTVSVRTFHLSGK